MAEAGFYGIAAVGEPIGEGITDSRWATLNGVVKMNHEQAAYAVANEYICGLLGLSVGLPVPPGTIARLDDGSVAFVMLRFGLKGEKPPPASPSDFVRDRARMAARVAVFDCWILNGDRHQRNFAYIEGEGASIFDHGHALFGPKAEVGVAHLDDLAAQPFWVGALTQELQSGVDLFAAAEVIRSCHDDLVREACEAPRRLGIITSDEQKKVVEVLLNRKKSLQHFIDVAHESFPKIEDWGLTA